MADQDPRGQRRGRLLVVDDDRAIVEMVEDYFTEQGLEVVVAYDGAEALRLAQNEPPDVVLLDITMPDMSGVNVLQQMRNRWPDLHVIMLSGIVDEALAKGTLQRGAFDYVVKPFRWERIHECVFAALTHGGQA